MYNMVDALKEILAMADKPDREINRKLLEAKVMELAAHIDTAATIPTELIEAMPEEMKRAAVSVALGTLIAVLHGA